MKTKRGKRDELEEYQTEAIFHRHEWMVQRVGCRAGCTACCVLRPGQWAACAPHRGYS
jgi:hypothetical protein